MRILFVIIHTVKTEFNQFWMKSYRDVQTLLIRLFFHILQSNLIVEAGRSSPSVVVGMNTNRKNLNILKYMTIHTRYTRIEYNSTSRAAVNCH